MRGGFVHGFGRTILLRHRLTGIQIIFRRWDSAFAVHVSGTGILAGIDNGVIVWHLRPIAFNHVRAVSILTLLTVDIIRR